MHDIRLEGGHPQREQTMCVDRPLLHDVAYSTVGRGVSAGGAIAANVETLLAGLGPQVSRQAARIQADPCAIYTGVGGIERDTKRGTDFQARHRLLSGNGLLGETIAQAPLGEYVDGLLGVLLQLFAQAAHVDA